MNLKFWRQTPDPNLPRIADALEKLVLLTSLDLRSRGISHSLEEGVEEGEIYYENADPRDVHAKLVAAREAELEAAKREYDRDLARTDFSATVWAGPEGAEDAAFPL